MLFFAVLLHASIDTRVQWAIFAGRRKATFDQRLISLLFLLLTLLGEWTALQGAINFCLTAEQLADRQERLVARQWARMGSCMVKPPAQYLIVIGILRGGPAPAPLRSHQPQERPHQDVTTRALQAVPPGAKDAAPAKIWRG